MNKKLFERILDLSGQKPLSESYPFKQSPLIREEDDFRNHDYDPSWDYDVNETPDPDLAKLVNKLVVEMKKDLLSQIEELKDIEVHFINAESDNVLARYISGTRYYANFVMDIENIKRACEEYPNINLGTAIVSTLAHEVGHAMQDIYDLDPDENQAEEFGIDYTDYGEVNKFWEKIEESLNEDKISFDFDGTLRKYYDWEIMDKIDPEPIEFMVNKFKELSQNNDIYIVSSRSMKDRQDIVDFVKEHNLKAKGIYTVGFNNKINMLKTLGVVKHFDDDKEEINLCKKEGIEGVLVD